MLNEPKFRIKKVQLDWKNIKNRNFKILYRSFFCFKYDNLDMSNKKFNRQISN